MRRLSFAHLLAATAPVAARRDVPRHTVVGAAGVWSLCRTLEIAPVVRAVAVLTYLLGTTGRDAACAALLLGLSAGVALATTHPGHVPVYGTIVVAVGAARYPAIRVRWRWVALAAVIALVIASPNFLHFAAEGDRFNPDLGLVKFREPLPLSSASGVFFKPLSHLGDPAGTPSSEARGVFFGGPFAALCLAGLVWRWRTHLDLALGVAISAVLLCRGTTFATRCFSARFRSPPSPRRRCDARRAAGSR